MKSWSTEVPRAPGIYFVRLGGKLRVAQRSIVGDWRVPGVSKTHSDGSLARFWKGAEYWPHPIPEPPPMADEDAPDAMQVRFSFTTGADRAEGEARVPTAFGAWLFAALLGADLDRGKDPT